MFSKLPAEILYLIFNELETPMDHVQLSRTCQTTWFISQHLHLRNKLLFKFLDTEGNRAFLSHNTALYQEVCRLIASSEDMKPKSNQISQILQEQIETSHFATFGYTNLQVKAAILDLFRPQCQRTKDKLIKKNYDDKTTTSTMRQHTSYGPRRVYYDITLPFLSGNKFFKCVFYDLNKVTAFDESYEKAYEGVMQFEDEGIVSTMSWQSIFTATTVDETQHVTLPGYNEEQQTIEGCDHNNKPVNTIVPDTRYMSLINKTPTNWKPCLLHVYHDCTLLTPIKKGGLEKERKFKNIFVYENKHDDTICIEFCTLGKDNKSVVPRGYLLMKEHYIQWQA